jgi:FkbH-like protein
MTDALQMALESHLASTEVTSPAAVRALAQAILAAERAGQVDDAARALRAAALPSLDFTSAQTLARLQRLLASRLPHPGKVHQVALLGTTTTDQLAQLLSLFLFAFGLDASVEEAPYGALRQEILDPDSRLNKSKPRTVILATGWRDLLHAPEPGDGREAVSERVRKESSEWASLWAMLYTRLGCQIVQNNFDRPPWRIFGNLDGRHSASLGRYIGLVNQALADEAPAYVTLHDLDALAASVGRWTWGDERFYHHAKLPCAPEYLVDYAHSLASLVAAQGGLARKCLVLDLDNTLWGGVIGDDGLAGIRLGQGDPEGEAYQAFQRYVKGLRSRGVILAVCSKNEAHIAREAFERHDGMILKLDDIACFVANWNDKPANLRLIAQQLNIGLNALVFADDHPAERAAVRQLTPEVAVPEMPEDPAGYVRAIERHRYFQVISVNAEDLGRTEMYRANAAREQSAASASSLDDFLESLQMRAIIAPIRAATLERTAQLIGRSNQFNLTTRRYSVAEVQALAARPEWITRTVGLADRFGDNGLISVVLAVADTGVLRIDTWLMSCRVLKRGVEDLLLNHLVREALRRGLHAIQGEYVPTAKNGLARDHYARLGFRCRETGNDGRTLWDLAVDAYEDRPVHIAETERDAGSE